MRFSLPGAGTLGCVVWPVAGMTRSTGVPPDLYPPHVGVGPLDHVISTASLCHPTSSVPKLPISTPPTHLDTYGFFKALVVRLPHNLAFLAVLGIFCFEVSCDSPHGCGKRWSMSAYASILTSSQKRIIPNVSSRILSWRFAKCDSRPPDIYKIFPNLPQLFLLSRVLPLFLATSTLAHPSSLGR